MTTTDTIKEFFTETEWDMIYEFIGNALDDDPEQVHSIRSKINDLFE